MADGRERMVDGLNVRSIVHPLSAIIHLMTARLRTDDTVSDARTVLLQELPR
jgi:hypothetical protein